MNPPAPSVGLEGGKREGGYGMSITLKAQSNQFDEAKKESLRRRGWSWTKFTSRGSNGEIFIETVSGMKPK